MDNQETGRYPNHLWFVLALAWIAQVCVAWSWFLIPSLGYELFPDLGLTHSQFTMILTAPLMSGMLIALVSGGFGDRYGIRLAIFVGTLIAGVSGFSRAFVGGFSGIFILTLFTGVSNGFLMPNLTKLVSIWFPPRQVGLASGIYVSAQAFGLSVGLLTGPLFSNWRLAFFYVGIITLVAAGLWALLARSTPKGVFIAKTEIKSGMIRGIKSKNIVLLCSMSFLVMGAFIAFSGNLPKALIDVQGVVAEMAGGIASFITWGALLGAILVPAISDKLKRRKPFLLACGPIAGSCYILGWLFAPGHLTEVLVFTGGLFQGGLVSIVFAQVMEFPEISPKHVGGAAGLVSSSGQLGGILLPLLLISPIITQATSTAYATGFIVVTVLFMITILPALFLIETGSHKHFDHTNSK